MNREQDELLHLLLWMQYPLELEDCLFLIYKRLKWLWNNKLIWNGVVLKIIVKWEERSILFLFLYLLKQIEFIGYNKNENG